MKPANPCLDNAEVNTESMSPSTVAIYTWKWERMLWNGAEFTPEKRPQTSRIPELCKRSQITKTNKVQTADHWL